MSDTSQRRRATLAFLLYDWLDAGSLTSRPRHADHSRETFDALLDACERIARERFAPFNRLVDVEEPRFDGERVHLPAATLAATRAYAESGLLAAGQDAADGGLQLPYLIDMAANTFFAAASVGLSGYSMLTYGNCNLLMAHGTDAQKRAFAYPEMSARFFGTMCLSEPQAGSSLGDVATRAVPDGAAFQAEPLGPRYRLEGSKMWISAGDHELGENIVHLVLARIAPPGQAPVPGVKGLSLFIVPRTLVDAEGRVTGERNDVALAGLNHKLGYRGTLNTLLSFGEGTYPVRAPGGLDGQGSGAIGYLVGQPGEGLRVMFHMMNEARLNVGMGAAMLGVAGYEASLDYARVRTQGRLPGAAGKDERSPPVAIISHPDVRRMLLAQKSYSEGALALCLYGARLVDEKRTGGGEEARQAGTLLELLTPVAKSWPSQWCLESNSLAIQVLGGYGYTRDFPVEQYWRDNRLNMIHEGTHGIQALDLLGRKVLGDDGTAMRLWAGRVEATLRRARDLEPLRPLAEPLAAVMRTIEQAVEDLRAHRPREQVLASASDFMQAFGHAVVAWIWLDVACAAAARLATEADRYQRDWLSGTLQAARYFLRFELPKVGAWLEVARRCDPTYREMPEAWF
jgi:butyryl-CoA dehydrogenase